MATPQVSSPADVPVPDSAVVLFRKYKSNEEITKEDVQQAAYRVWQKAITVNPFRCIREFRFLISRLALHPWYKTRVTTGDLTFKYILDIGSCFGTDLRQLIADGADPKKLLGIEKEESFLALGDELYGDTESSSKRPTMVSGDVLQPEAFIQQIRRFHDQFDLVHLGAVLHLLLEDQIKLVLFQSALPVTKRGGLLLGEAVGKHDPGIATLSENPKHPSLRYLHSPQSLKELLENSGEWRDVETGWLREPEGEKYGLLYFGAVRK